MGGLMSVNVTGVASRARDIASSAADTWAAVVPNP